MFFEMLSAWSASFLAGMTRISTEMNHRACRERERERETTEPSTDDAAAVVAEPLFSPFQVYPRPPDHFPIADDTPSNRPILGLVASRRFLVVPRVASKEIAIARNFSILRGTGNPLCD
jgi:hypothetical protein